MDYEYLISDTINNNVLIIYKNICFIVPCLDEQYCLLYGCNSTISVAISVRLTNQKTTFETTAVDLNLNHFNVQFIYTSDTYRNSK